MTGTSKVHLIVNPFSARGKTEDRWKHIKEAFHLYFREFKYIFTEKPCQATAIARELLEDGFDLIVGVGGDGTLNEIANGFFEQDSLKKINEDASLAIIPSGTGSDFTRFLKIPRDFKKSIELIKNTSPRKLDLGKITFSGPGMSTREKLFVNVADFGLGAEVIRRLAAFPARKRSSWIYYSGLLSTLKNFTSRHIKLKLDDHEEIEGRFLIGAIANGRIFGGGMQIAPSAEPDDGYLNLTLIQDMSKPRILTKSLSLYTGNIEKIPQVITRKVKKIDVSSEDDVFIEYDGELGWKLPATFQCIPGCINFRF